MPSTLLTQASAMPKLESNTCNTLLQYFNLRTYQYNVKIVLHQNSTYIEISMITLIGYNESYYDNFMSSLHFIMHSMYIIYRL